MRFALLGTHPDGIALVSALVASGRHQVIAFTAAVPDPVRRRWGEPRQVGDLEEVLADPAVEAVVVAGPLAERPAQLRRALQSERHVLCVHPPDDKPEIAYEAAMIRQDVGRVLLPLLVKGLHPAVHRLAEFIDRHPEESADDPVGAFRLLEVERTATEEVLLNLETPGAKPTFPGWDALRRLGGDVAEVSAFAAAEEVGPGAPVLLAGHLERGGLFQMTLLPGQPAERWRLTVVGTRGRAELTLPLGADGPAELGWRDADGTYHAEYWDRWDPWPDVLACFEAAVAGESAALPLDWQDTVRALELDDAARRSVQRRRSSTMEYQEASEEVGFKGTMTLVGCGVVWIVILLLILSRWVPMVGWLIVPLLVVFLILQLLRYAVPAKEAEPPAAGGAETWGTTPARRIEPQRHRGHREDRIQNEK